MSIIVQKYGGSSLSDIDKIRKVAAIIAAVKREGYQVAVVVSAMGKTTNQLIDMAKGITENPPRREMDMLLSTGERVAMSLLCMALSELGIEAISLTGSQSGIITNDKHNDARVIEVRPFRVHDELDSGKVVVVGGFQGVSYKRDITTLGRGGSDTSAVALAAALNAERCEIYSDVDGVYTADPSLIKEAAHLPEISYQQMQEMAMAGAKVLNAQAVQFAKESKIAIYARSTFRPGKETIVRLLPAGVEKGVKSVVHENDIVRVVLSGNIENNFPGMLSILEERQISIKELNMQLTGSDPEKSKASFVISYKNVYGWDKIREELKVKFKDDLQLEYDFGAVSLIGEGLNRDNLILMDTLAFLRERKIQVFGITTTSFRISLLVPKEKVDECTKLLHKKWVEEI
jgi:aspartate kinase